MCHTTPQDRFLWDIARMSPLTTPHERALMLLFAELESTAAEQVEAFLGTPGMLDERTNEKGARFWVHRYSDALGKRRELYLGVRDDPAVKARVAALRERIDAANAAIARVRLLARAGFATVNRKAYATLASLHNHRLFRAGALLIGSRIRRTAQRTRRARRAICHGGRAYRTPRGACHLRGACFCTDVAQDRHTVLRGAATRSPLAVNFLRGTGWLEVESRFAGSIQRGRLSDDPGSGTRSARHGVAAPGIPPRRITASSPAESSWRRDGSSARSGALRST
jgi:hypothetical protein